jgi:hypothetical protein
MRTTFNIIDLFVQGFLLLLAPVLVISIFLSVLSIPVFIFLILFQFVSSAIRASASEIGDRFYLFLGYWLLAAMAITDMIVSFNLGSFHGVLMYYLLSVAYFILSVADTIMNKAKENINNYYNEQKRYNYYNKRLMQ